MKRRSLFLSIAFGIALTGLLLVALDHGDSTTYAMAEPSLTAGEFEQGIRDEMQDEVSQAHIVVQFSDGDIAVRPVTWTGTITRVSLLRRAGFDVETNATGFICSIDGNGCPVANCFGCGDNNWVQGQWAGTAWAEPFPFPAPSDGDVFGFRNDPDWGLTGKLPGAPAFVAASDALEWMRDYQLSDGSYPSWSGPIAGSTRALIALGAAGYDPAEWGDPSLLTFLTVTSRTQTADFAATSASSAGKLAIGAAWTDQVVTDFASINLPISITAYYSPTTGAYGAGSGDTAWAMLGLHASGENIPTQAVEFLKSVQNADGGWAWNEWGTTSEVQHTALCIQALLAAGEPLTTTEASNALAFIESAENPDGGYGYTAGGDSDLNTTAYVLQTLLATEPRPECNWCAEIRLRYLLSKQETDGSYAGFSPLYSVQEAVPVLMHRPYSPVGSWSYDCYVDYLPLVTSGHDSGS